MKAYKISLFVYADSDDEANALERDLLHFVVDKREQGIAVRAGKLSSALARFKDNIIINNYLK